MRVLREDNGGKVFVSDGMERVKGTLGTLGPKDGAVFGLAISVWAGKGRGG